MSAHGRRLLALMGLGVASLAVAMAACGPSTRASQLDVIESALDAGPGRDADTYVAPKPPEAAEIADAVAGLVDGGQPAAPPGYEVLVDEGVDVLVEVPVQGQTRGWGLYAVRGDSPSTVVVQVVHPRADRYSEVIGARIFDEAQARVLMVAGAHRTASGGDADVAHAPGSVFAAVDDLVVQPGWIVLQVHGFAAANHPGIEAEAVLSSGSATPGPVVEAIAAALEEQGISTCVYDGVRCASLAGTRNLLGQHARDAGAGFVHFELADSVRNDPQRRDTAIAAVSSVLRP